MTRLCVFGIGSPAGDDQAGWLTIDGLHLAGVRTGGGLVVEKLDRPGAGLVALMEGADRVILIDAMAPGGRPGSIGRFGPADWPDYARGLSSHGIGVLDALALAAALGGLPARLDLYGVEMAAASPVDRVSEPVRAAARELAGRIASELGRGVAQP